MFADASHSPVVEAQRGNPDLPPESRLSMPRQALFGDDAPNFVQRVKTQPAGMKVRRALIVGATVAMTLSALIMLEQAMPETDNWILPAAFLGVFALLFGWISFAFLTCIAGVCRMLYDREDERLGLTDTSPLPSLLKSRTALLAPIYNEDPDEVARRLRAIDSVLTAQGMAQNFHIFILSDSTDADVLQPEYDSFVHLRAHAVDGERRIFYRRRTKNIERKAGNIADWVRTFGADYDNMVTLDADSLMSAETLIRLAAAMERHDDVGLIQTTPRLVGRSSLFGRMEQFAHRLYGPLLSHGMAWWSGAEANYYGHNAIIRTRAFADHCGLPVLPGARPFGGAVLSHDFVEAALIRRGGWAVLHAPSLSGSYEECPPTMTDFLDRDRRWCQGNVQHLGLLSARGVHWVSRLHMLIGAWSYFTAPLWLAFMVLGLMLRSISPEDIQPTHPGGPSGLVYVICMGLLFLPKFLAFAIAMRDPETRRGFGGPTATLAGIGVQSVISALMAPILMWSQTRALFDILTGRDSGWKSQRRSERGIDMREAAKRYRSHTALGIALAFAALAATPHSLSGTNFSTVAWMAPVLLGLLLAAPIGSFTARADMGEGLRRLGILSTPEETLPVRVLILTNHPPRVIHSEEQEPSLPVLAPVLRAEAARARYGTHE